LSTGASTGIGSKTAIEFAKEGYSLALCGWKESPVDKAGLEDTVSKCLATNCALEKHDVIYKSASSYIAFK
jgi:NADP-dependent 3-hydroxy acid dehydrogenase YdfG